MTARGLEAHQPASAGPLRRYRAKPSVMDEMARGEVLADRGRMPAAIARFDRAVALDPLCIQAYLYRAGLKLLAKDERGAREDFEVISKLDHSHAAAYRDLATLSVEMFPELWNAQEAFIARYPACAWARVARVFSLRTLWRYEEAVVEMKRALACAPGSATLWAISSRVKLVNNGRRFDGLSDLERALSLQARWGWLHCWHGEALRHMGRPAAALRALDRGLALDERYRLGFAWRGGVKVALGRHKAALEDFARFFERDPVFHSSYDPEQTRQQQSWAHNQSMLALRGLGRTVEALSSLNRAHALESRYGWVYAPNGDERLYSTGVAELDAAAARHPRRAWVYAWRGWTHERFGRLEAAIEDYDRALLLKPDLAWPWAWKGRALTALRDFPAAGRALDRAVTLDPRYAEAWGARARARLALGQVRRAKEDFERVVGLDYRAAWAYAGRAECETRLGRPKRALADFSKAIAIYPGYGQAFAGRAAVRRQLGDAAGARLDAAAALRR